MTLVIESTERVTKTDPEMEYLSGGVRSPLVGGYGSIAAHILNVTERGGTHLPDLMLTDPKIAASIRTIKDGILAQGMQITATVQIDPEDTPGSLTQAEIDRAFEIEDHCERSWRNLKGSRTELLRRMLDAMAYRTMLSEVVRIVADSGPDEGKYLLDHISVKEPGTWGFVLDAFGNVRGIQAHTLARNGTGTAPSILERDKFLILPWLPRGSNPYGQGLLAEAYNAWNFKVQLYPMLWKYCQLFAVPTVHASPPEGASDRQLVDADGAPTGKPLPATMAMAKELETMFRTGGSRIVTPGGSTLDFLDPPGEGQVFQLVFDMLDRAIVYALHNTTLAMGVQGKRSSGTDAASGHDLLGLVISYGKWALKEMLYRDLWYPHVLINFGPEDAERFTPEVSFGMTDPQDLSRNGNMVARLWAAGVLQTEDERQGALRLLGLSNFFRSRKKSDPNPNLATQPGANRRPVNVVNGKKEAA